MSKLELIYDEDVIEKEIASKVNCKGINCEAEFLETEFSEYLKKHFEACNINFLIGAGYSDERLSTLGNLEELIENNAIKNIDNAFTRNAIQALILFDFFDQSIYNHKGDIEAMTSFDNSDKFIYNIGKMLTSRNDKNLMSRANIFTTNYDMYIELSLEQAGVYYNDGFSGRLIPKFSCHNYNRIAKQIVQNTERESQIPLINLYKFHGSLTWDKREKDILYRLDVPMLLDGINEAGEVFDYERFFYTRKTSEGKSNLYEAIEKINCIGLSEERDLTDEIERFVENYSSLFIINPTKKKFEETLLSNIYYDLLRMYSNELEKINSLLIVFGFSFRDEHIRDITRRALSNPSLIMYIFVYEKDQLKWYEELFESLNNVFFVYFENMKIDLPKFTKLIFG